MYIYTAPGLPPQNVMVVSAEPESLYVSWQLPSDNGPITGHVIQYTRVGSSDTITINVTSGTTHTISGLAANVQYSVKVAALNVSGTGPFSDPVIAKVSDSELILTVLS